MIIKLKSSIIKSINSKKKLDPNPCHCLNKNWSYRETCPVLLTNTDHHIIGTVGVVGSEGATSTVVVLQDELDALVDDEDEEKDEEG